MISGARISKYVFYRGGGFANTRQFRKMRSGVWQYFESYR